MGHATTTENQPQRPATLTERLNKAVFPLPAAVMDAKAREPQQSQLTIKGVLAAFGIVAYKK